MTLYTLPCDRCGGRTTHGKVGHEDPNEYKSVQDHKGTTVYCRRCEDSAILSKGDIEGDENIVAEIEVSDSLGLTVHPDFIREDETLQEYIERELRKNHLGQIAAEMADGIRDSQVEVKRVKREDDV